MRKARSMILPILVFSMAYFVGCDNQQDSQIATGTITVTVVNQTGEALDGEDVYVKSFSEGGNIPDDTIETVHGTLSGDQVTVELTNGGAEYSNGTYDLRAHIDKGGGEIFNATAGDDFVGLDQVVISGGDAIVTVNVPPGSYDAFIVYNDGNTDPGSGKTAAAIPGGADGKTLYLIVVEQGNTWGNYTYMTNSVLAETTFISPNRIWGPYGDYAFHAFIDMDDDFGSTGGPDTGDYTYSNNVTWSSDDFPDQVTETWTQE
jgi:hypothetical protein